MHNKHGQWIPTHCTAAHEQKNSSQGCIWSKSFHIAWACDGHAALAFLINSVLEENVEDPLL